MREGFPRHGRRLAALLALVLLAAAAPAQAASRATWAAAADRIAASMKAAQQPNGLFRDDYKPNSKTYAEAIGGYGLLLHADRTGDAAAADAGMRAVTFAAAPDPRPGPDLDSVFKQLGVAAAYALAVERFPDHPEFVAHRAEWEAWLRRMRPQRVTGPGGGVANRLMVESLAQLELLRTGLTGGAPGTVVADPAGARRNIRSFMAVRWPRAVADTLRRGRFGSAGVHSDQPGHPLAYHALALAMAQRAIARLGDATPAATLRTTRRLARGSWELAAPDGDVAYFGRSHEQSWALPLTAAGVEEEARREPRAVAARMRALTDRVAARLERSHGFGPLGVNIVPIAASDREAARAAIDTYASQAVYNALTLVSAEWAHAAMRGPALSADGGIAADRSGGRVLGYGAGMFATARRDGVWAAVRMRPGLRTQRSDARYAFGLVAAKARSGAGWRDLVTGLPRTTRGADAPGPWLLGERGVDRAEPFGSEIAVTRGGVIEVEGGFRSRAGRVVRRAAFQYRPGDGTVRTSVRVRAGDRLEIAEFVPTGSRRHARIRFRARTTPARPARTPAIARPARAPTIARPARTPTIVSRSRTPGFASATDGWLDRVATVIEVSAGGTLTWRPGTITQ